MSDEAQKFVSGWDVPEKPRVYLYPRKSKPGWVYLVRLGSTLGTGDDAIRSGGVIFATWPQWMQDAAIEEQSDDPA